MIDKLNFKTILWRISRQMGTLVFLFLTLLALYQGEVTIFYIIYFFWWSELLRIIIDALYRQKAKVKIDDTKPVFLISSLFMMGIYFVFILVFFGFIANWNNEDMMLINFDIMLFRNWFFNLNLILVLLELISRRSFENREEFQFGAFSPNMLVLHISIIFGGLMLFFIVKRFPETFSPDNTWGSLIIISPFLILRILIQGFCFTKLKKES